MEGKLTFYDFAGYIVPGTIVLGLVSWLYVALSGRAVAVSLENLGTSVIFLIGSYVVGHVIQPPGNWIEEQRKKEWGGWFSEQFLRDDSPRYTGEFKQKLKALIQQTFDLSPDVPTGNEDLQKKRRLEVFNLCYSLIEQKGAADQTDSFNGRYGLYRQLIVAAWIGVWVSLIIVVKNGALLITIAVGAGMPNDAAFRWDPVQFVSGAALLVVSFLLIGPLTARMKRFSMNFADSVYRSFYAWGKTQDGGGKPSKEKTTDLDTV